MKVSTEVKRARFRRLHESGCFVIPNPWDAGSARALETLGFQALASSSAGFAWTTGRPDGGVTCAAVVAHLQTLVDAVDLPINADFEHGYSHDDHELAHNVAAAAETGICGLSIEDATGNPGDPLLDRDRAAARIRIARAALDRVDPALMLVGRCECYLVGRPDRAETISRLQAYAEAGADCLFAPGIRTEADIAALVAAVAPKPVNVVVSAPGHTVAGLAALGVRRISVGGALARVAWSGFLQAAEEIAAGGAFLSFGGITPSAEINGLFAPRPPAA